MEALLPNSVKLVLLGVLESGFALAWLARALPDVAWLQLFRLVPLQLSEEREQQLRRSANRQTALEMMICGAALPLLYLVSTFMLFNEPKVIPMLVVGACSLLCFALGIWILIRNRLR